MMKFILKKDSKILNWDECKKEVTTAPIDGTKIVELGFNSEIAAIDFANQEVLGGATAHPAPDNAQ